MFLIQKLEQIILGYVQRTIKKMIFTEYHLCFVVISHF